MTETAANSEMGNDEEKDEYQDADIKSIPPVSSIAPAPRKRGRPRKVNPKNESSILLPHKDDTVSIDAESKKQKKPESPSAAGKSQGQHHFSKIFTRVPLRREGNRRKSEPRRAAD
ncbi:hypothetical protein KP509_38G037600 [Ceratopteris richardii]|nr:hypothetical protein KP509_38G037600 [Ceratopteris richardii]